MIFANKIGRYFHPLYISLLLTVGCTGSLVEDEPLKNVNSFSIDGIPLVFNSARLTLTGPVTVNGQLSHYLSLLELSSMDEYTGTLDPGASLMTLELNSENTGRTPPRFPIDNATYDVFESSSESAEFPVNFIIEPRIQIGYHSNTDSFQTTYSGTQGTLQIVFDLSANRVQLVHNWKTTDGKSVSGSQSIPVNLGSFHRP